MYPNFNLLDYKRNHIIYWLYIPKFVLSFFKGDVEAFVKALQNNKKSPSGDEQKKKDEEEDMALD